MLKATNRFQNINTNRTHTLTHVRTHADTIYNIQYTCTKIAVEWMLNSTSNEQAHSILIISFNRLCHGYIWNMNWCLNWAQNLRVQCTWIREWIQQDFTFNTQMQMRMQTHKKQASERTRDVLHNGFEFGSKCRWTYRQTRDSFICI